MKRTHLSTWRKIFKYFDCVLDGCLGRGVGRVLGPGSGGVVFCLCEIGLSV